MIRRGAGLENAWHSHVGGADGGANITTTGLFGANNLNALGFHVKARLHYIQGNNPNIAPAGFFMRAISTQYDVYWNGAGGQAGGLPKFNPPTNPPKCCPPLPGLPGSTDFRDGFHDYIFSLDPNAGVAGEFSYFVDGVILATLPIADFAGTGEDLFGFTPFQGGGGGNTEEFYVHNLSLFSGPAGSPPTDFEWTVDSAGDWTNSGNWSAGGPPGVDPQINTNHTVMLGAAISENRTVFSDSDVTLKAITFDNSANYNIAGHGSVSPVQGTTGPSDDSNIEVIQGNHQFSTGRQPAQQYDRRCRYRRHTRVQPRVVSQRQYADQDRQRNLVDSQRLCHQRRHVEYC